MKRSIRYLILAIVVIAAVTGTVLWLRSRQGQSTEQETRSATVERGSLLVAVPASGSVEPHNRIELAFEVPGQVAGVAVGIGDEVHAGDVLALLDTSDLALLVSQAEISLQAAQLRLERLQEPADEADVQVARAAVSDAAAAYEAAQQNLILTEHSVSVGDAVRTARAARDETFRIYQELQAKYDDHAPFVSEQMVTAAHDAYLNALGAYNRAVEGAEMQLTTAQNEVNRAYHALVQAQNNLDRLLEGASRADLEAAQLDVDAAALNLQRAQSDLDKAALEAPFDGIVAAVNIKQGQAAPTGLPAISLLDTSTFHIDVSVDEMDVGRLAVGQAALVTLDALPDVEITGTVRSIAPAADLEGGIVYYGVVIDLVTDIPIRADMSANATIVVQELDDVLIIPTWVVRVDQDTGQTYVQRRTGNTTERVDVSLGTRYGGMAHVLEGLSEGDVVVWVESNSFDFGRP